MNLICLYICSAFRFVYFKGRNEKKMFYLSPSVSALKGPGYIAFLFEQKSQNVMKLKHKNRQKKF